jgi:hypothetical protein
MQKTLVYLVTTDWYFLSHRLELALEAKSVLNGNPSISIAAA